MKPYLIQVYVVGGVYRYIALSRNTCAAVQDAIDRFEHYEGNFRVCARPA